MFISITGSAGYTKTHSMISGEPILSAIRQWSYRNFGEVPAGLKRSEWSLAYLIWLPFDGSPPCPTGGRLADSCDTSVTGSTGTSTSAEIFKTTR